jgi:arabinofuranan 3-O-arabinosyltransferase
MYLSNDVVNECFSAIQKKFIALLIPEVSIGSGYWSKCVALERYISTYLEEGMNECCRFFRKDDAEKIGGYDPNIVGAEDSDFHYRMKRLGKIGKIKSIIYHDEGVTNVFSRIKKKYYYSKAFRLYLKRYQSIAINQFSPLKSSYIKHIDLFLAHPILTLGIVFFRGGEVLAGVTGLILNK